MASHPTSLIVATSVAMAAPMADPLAGLPEIVKAVAYMVAPLLTWLGWWGASTAVRTVSARYQASAAEKRKRAAAIRANVASGKGCETDLPLAAALELEAAQEEASGGAIAAAAGRLPGG